MTTLLEMKKKSTEEYVRIMQAWLAGKIILVAAVGSNRWATIKYPGWDFVNNEYRILEEEPVTDEGDIRNAA